MNWLESIIYGLVSGFSEFLPISSPAHQAILLRLFGVDQRDPVQDFLIHLAILLASILCCWSTLGQIRKDRSTGSRRRGRHTQRSSLDFRVVKTAAVPLLVGLLMRSLVEGFESDLILLMILFLVNGIILYLPERMLQGNKNARSMSALDSILIGIGGVLSVFPGISLVGSTASVAIVRGADKQHALKWALLLNIFALFIFTVFDVFGFVFQGIGAASASYILHYLLSAAGSFLGAYLGIMFMRYLTVKAGFSGFAYYSWGAALFSFILYLTVV